MTKLQSILFAAVLALPLAAAAQPQGAYTELSPPQPTESKGQIEVVEFFWYGCIHCYTLEPHIEAWHKKLPRDVAFRRIPAVFNQRWAHDAAIFYTFEAMGLVDKLHRPLFDAIHRDRLRTDDQAAFAGWLEQQGVEPKKFFDTMKSFAVQSRTRRAVQQTVAYKIDGTPAMAVNGRYTVSAGQGGTQQGMLQTVDALVTKLRKEQ
ncbi:MAG TPA: thiol:disulfide interchange protein DsbA/DsbL [Burkholderiales bacterium]|nr:thiol:disulfide interchange protein DsbA/DsbL [Burkholderiales bacterium]